MVNLDLWRAIVKMVWFFKSKKSRVEHKFPSRKWDGWLNIPLFGSFIHESRIERAPILGWFKRGAEKAAFMSRVMIGLLFLIVLAVLWYLFKRPAKALLAGEKAGKGITTQAMKKT